MADLWYDIQFRSSSSSSISLSSSSESSSSSLSSSSSSISLSSSSESQTLAEQACNPDTVAAYFEPDSSWGGNNYTFRTIIPARLINQSGSTIKIIHELSPSRSKSFALTEVWVGHAAASGSTTFDGNQQQVFYNNGSPGFEIPLVSGIGTQQVSDPITFNLDANTDLIISWWVDGDDDGEQSVSNEIGADGWYYLFDDQPGNTVAPTSFVNSYPDKITGVTAICVI